MDRACRKTTDTMIDVRTFLSDQIMSPEQRAHCDLIRQQTLLLPKLSPFWALDCIEALSKVETLPPAPGEEQEETPMMMSFAA